MKKQTDETLYAAVRSGSEEAFKQLYLKYQCKLFTFCYGLTDDEETAKDLVQETFITFWEKRDAVLTDYSLIAYLFKIAHSKCYHHLQHANRTRTCDLETLRLSEIELNYYDEETITGSLYFTEVKDAYEKAVEKLPPQCQTVYVMNREEELKSRDIADRLSLSLRTVESHLYRAARLIRKELKRYVLFFF